MQGIPKVQDFLDRRDFQGAITVLELNYKEVQVAADEYENRDDLLAYSAFHASDYELAKRIYADNGRSADLAITTFYMRDFDDVLEILQDVPDSERKSRIAMHLENILGSEDAMALNNSKLIDIPEDQLSLAALHYFRGSYQEALEIYKKYMTHFGQNTAVAVYAAMCYYQLDFFDVAIDLAEGYLKTHPDSIIAANLKACCHHRLGNVKSAMDSISHLKDALRHLPDHICQIVRHNITVLRDGDGALQFWPQCVASVPEAKLNLVIHYLRHVLNFQDDLKNAYELAKDLEPVTFHQTFIKAIAYCSTGLEDENPEFVEIAENYFHTIGSSPGDCDTITGRQAMASYLFLENRLEEALVYMDSIKSYCSQDDIFNLNYGQAKAALAKYDEALESLLIVTDNRMRTDFTYLACLAKCYVATGHPDQAWELHTSAQSTEEIFALVQLIASCSYKGSYFMIAAKAYQQAAKLDAKNMHHWFGLRASVAGVLKSGIEEGKSDQFETQLAECCDLLKNVKLSDAEQFANTIVAWGRNNQIYI